MAFLGKWLIPADLLWQCPLCCRIETHDGPLPACGGEPGYPHREVTALRLTRATGRVPTDDERWFR